MDYNLDQENINYILQDYHDFLYDPKKNRRIKKFPVRNLYFEIKERVYTKGGRPEINAYSFYDVEADRIYITTKLVDMIYNIILNSEKNEDSAAWISFVAMMFCSFHELGHLYIGHCQLCDTLRLAAVDEAEAGQSGLDIKDYQALEADADTFAARRVAEKTASMIHNGDCDGNLLYLDTLKGVCAFFYVLEYLEVMEARRQHDISVKTGREERGRRPGEATHRHPPAIARCVYSGITMMGHMKQFFKIPEQRTEFMNILLSCDELFGGFPLTPEQYQRKYADVLNGSFLKTFEEMKKYWLRVLRKRLKNYSRVPLFPLLL